MNTNTACKKTIACFMMILSTENKSVALAIRSTISHDGSRFCCKGDGEDVRKGLEEPLINLGRK